MRRLLLSALLAVTFATGCGDDEETTATAPGAETTTAPETTSPTETPGPYGSEEEAPGGDVAAGTPGDDPETALEAFFTSGDPDVVCGELATDELLSSAYGDEEGCRQAQAPAAVPDSLEIEGLDVSGAEAEAVVVPDGGPNDGIETTVTLVEDGGWRVDSLEADVPAGP